jgi:uncharacterized protein (UPF0276 family)
MHIAGHEQMNESLLIDTHGAEICDPVWQLLQFSYQHCGVKPTLLERDFNIPSWQQLHQELTTIKTMQQQENGYGAQSKHFPNHSAAIL